MTAAAGAAVVVRLVGVRRAGPSRVVLVGDEDAVDQHLMAWRSNGEVEVVGLAPFGEHRGRHACVPSDGPQRCGSIDDLPLLVGSSAADLVALLPGPGFDAQALRRATWALEHSPVAMVVLHDVAGIDPGRTTPRSVAGELGIELAPPRRSAVAAAVKHGIDRCGAALLLLLLAPLLVVLAVAVRLDSAGSPFFTQVRVGHHGRPFRMHKLRTMVAGADDLKPGLNLANEADGAFFKIRRDPRTTRVGALLRRTSLDELPQLVNVVRGEMSLIGPRPMLPSEAAALDAHARRRLVVRPGMTGLWQVSGRCELAWDESMALDAHYADNWGLSSDLRIAARTVVSVVSGRGAC